MIDPISNILGTIAAAPPTAAAGIFMAGLLSSIGPCVAPRFIVVTALAGNTKRSYRQVSGYLCGIVVGYGLIGTVAGSLRFLWNSSRTVDVLLSIALLCAGALSIVRARSCGPCGDRHHAPTTPSSLGGVFLLGIAGALVVSPCCTPMVGSIVAITSSLGRPLYGSALLGVFALGHASPLLATALAQSRFHAWVERANAGQASAIVSGALMLALGCFYGLIA